MITPTPWKVDDEGVFVMAEIPGYGQAPILEVRGYGRLIKFHGLSEEEAIAEQTRVGTLAAAAPALLEALEVMCNIAEEMDEWDKALTGRQIALRRAKEAIAKARKNDLGKS